MDEEHERWLLVGERLHCHGMQKRNFRSLDADTPSASRRDSNRPNEAPYIAQTRGRSHPCGRRRPALMPDVGEFQDRTVRRARPCFPSQNRAIRYLIPTNTV
jgi:hypothetical protein